MKSEFEMVKRAELRALADEALKADMGLSEKAELMGLIEVLDAHHDLPVNVCLSPPRRKALTKYVGPAYVEYEAKYLAEELAADPEGKLKEKGKWKN